MNYALEFSLVSISIILLFLIYNHRRKLLNKTEELSAEMIKENERKKTLEEELESRAMHKKDEELASNNDPEIENKIKSLFKKIDYHIEHENFDDAENCIMELREILNDDPHVIHKLGIVKIRQRNLNDAIAIYQELTKKKLDAMHFVNLGQCLLEIEKYEEALDSYLYALEMNKEYAHTFMQAGYIYEKLNRPQEAIKSYESALEIEPENAELRNHIMELKVRFPKNEESEIIKEVIEKD